MRLNSALRSTRASTTSGIVWTDADAAAFDVDAAVVRNRLAAFMMGGGYGVSIDVA
jgi:hypothetical protein